MRLALALVTLAAVAALALPVASAGITLAVPVPGQNGEIYYVVVRDADASVDYYYTTPTACAQGGVMLAQESNGSPGWQTNDRVVLDGPDVSYCTPYY